MLTLTLAASLMIAPDLSNQQRQDLRCVILFGMQGSRAPIEKQSGLALGAGYYLGRVKGREPGIDVEKAILAAKPANEAELRPDITRCADELKLIGLEVKRAGDALRSSSAPAK